MLFRLSTMLSGRRSPDATLNRWTESMEQMGLISEDGAPYHYEARMYVDIGCLRSMAVPALTSTWARWAILGPNGGHAVLEILDIFN